MQGLNQSQHVCVLCFYLCMPNKTLNHVFEDVFNILLARHTHVLERGRRSDIDQANQHQKAEQRSIHTRVGFKVMIMNVIFVKKNY